MSDALRMLAQVSSRTAQDSTSDLQSVSHQQEEMLRQKENAAVVQSKLNPTGEATFAKSISKGIAAAKDEFEDKKPDPFEKLKAAIPHSRLWP